MINIFAVHFMSVLKLHSNSCYMIANIENVHIRSFLCECNNKFFSSFRYEKLLLYIIHYYK